MAQPDRLTATLDGTTTAAPAGSEGPASHGDGAERVSPSLREALFGEQRLLEQERLTRRSTWSNWTVLAMLVLCFFVLMQFRASSRRPARIIFQPSAHRTLRRIELRHLGGSEQVGSADLTGRVVLLTLFNPADRRSRQLLPALTDAVAQLDHPAGLRVLPVASNDEGGDNLSALFNQTQQFLREFGLSLRVYADPDRVTREAVRQIVGSAELPTTVLIDRRGHIRGVWRGADSETADDVGRQLDKLLDESQ